VTDGGQAIKAKAMERLKGESEAQEQRMKVTVRDSGPFQFSIILPSMFLLLHQSVPHLRFLCLVIRQLDILACMTFLKLSLCPADRVGEEIRDKGVG
jgi:hypothetical protein